MIVCLSVSLENTQTRCVEQQPSPIHNHFTYWDWSETVFNSLSTGVAGRSSLWSSQHSTHNHVTQYSLWKSLSSDSICLDLFYLRSAISSFEWRWGSFLINTHSGLPGLWNSKASSILQSACFRIRHRSPLRLAGPFHKLLIETIIK